MDDVDIRFGGLVLQPARRRLLRDGRPLAIGARAFDVLATLVAERHRMVTKAELLDAVWPDAVVEEANLAVQVSTLRRLIGGDAIATVPGRGYRFVAPIDTGAAAAAAGAPGNAVPAPAAAATPEPAPPPRAAGHLPGTSPLIGRDGDLAALAAAWSTARLVSILGAGGIGKTRLAHAHAQVSLLPDGMRWIDLSTVAADEDVVAAVAQGCAIPVTSHASVGTVTGALADKSMLLVLDNVEHVAGGVATLVAALLAAAPALRLLVTGQVPLGVAGERIHRLAPLAVPPPDATADESYAAVQLFIERARADNLRFAPDAPAMGQIAAICRALDGLPLAIELAAARVRLLGVHGVRERLDSMLRLLTRVRGLAHEQPPRQLTLRATLEWSHGMLSPREQRLLRQLAPFVGGFTLALAQAVAAGGDGEDGESDDAWGVLDGLGTLVDRCIVEVDGGDPPRFRLLETMRVFALEQLEQAGETAAARTRHARAVTGLFRRMIAQREARPPTLTQAQAHARTAPEFDNARAALDWMMGAGADPALAVELAGAWAPVGFQLGATHEVVQRLLALRPHLAAAAPAPRATLLLYLGGYGRQAGLSLAELRDIKEQTAREARASDDAWLRIRALSQLAWARATEGDIAGAEALTGEMQQLMPADAPAFMHVPLANALARVLEYQGRDDDAINCLQALRERLAAASPGEDVNRAMCEWNLCLHLLGAQRYEAALDIARSLASAAQAPAQYRISSRYLVVHALAALGRGEAALDEARAHRRELETGNLLMLGGYEALAMLALAAGRVDDAVRSIATIERHYRSAGGAPHRVTQRVRESIAVACAAAGCSGADMAAWRAQGEKLDGPALVALVLR